MLTNDLRCPSIGNVKDSLKTFQVVLGLLISMSSGAIFGQAWDGSSNNRWDNVANWTPATIPNTVSANATLGSIVTGQTTIGLRGTRTLGTLNFQGSQNFTINNGSGGTQKLLLDVSSGTAAINLSGSTASQIASSVNIVLYDNAMVTQNSTGLFTIAGVISENGGAKSLTHNGTGTTLLSGANTYSGGLTINSGTVRFGNDAAPGTGTLTINGGAIEASGGARVLNEAVLVGGNFSVVGSQALTLSATMNLGASQRTVTTSNSALTTFGTVSGSGGLTKAGAGVLTLGPGSSYTGATIVNAGTLRAGGNGTSFGNNSAVTLANVAGATLDLAGFSTTIGSLAGGGTTGGNVSLGAGQLTTGGDNTSTSYGGIISGTGGLTKVGSGTQTLSGANTYGGVTTASAGVLDVRNSSGLGSTAGGTVVNSGGTLALGGGITITNENLQISGVGAGSSGALSSVAGNNNFYGNITLGAQAEIENSVAGTTLTIGSTSFTNWINATAAGHTVTFDGSGDIFLNSAVTGTGNLTSVGPGSVIKNGSGTLTFYADENWYSGTTTVNDGTLVLDTLTARNGAIKGTVVHVGDGAGAAGSAVLRNGPILSPVANEMINDSATITFGSDGLYDINTHQESVRALDFTGGEVRTSTGGVLKITAGSPAAAITSHASSSTALIDATGGSFQLNGARTFTVADGAAARDLEVRGNIADGSAASGVTMTGAGRLSFTGTAANTYTGTTTVNGGTLELAKSSGVNSIAGSAITVNSGGTLLLGSSNQINDAANLTLSSGTFSNGDTVGFSETLGTLTLSGTSSIDLGTAAHMLSFANSSGLSGFWSGTLTIYGWTGIPEIAGTAGQIYFGSTASGLTSTQLAMISFNGFGPGAMLLTNGELVPTAVPEAGPVIAATLLALIVLWRERRRLEKFLPGRSA